jgi:hypothetical protein
MTDNIQKDEFTVDQSEIIRRFDDAPDSAFFTREEVAVIRRCSIAKLHRDSWLGKGIRFTKDGARCLYKKVDIDAFLNKGGNHVSS